jgi:hypothetical protein
MPVKKTIPSLRVVCVAALLLTLSFSPLYLAGRPDSPPAGLFIPLAGEAERGGDNITVKVWQEGSARYVRLLAGVTTASFVTLVHDVAPGEEIVVEQVVLTSGPFSGPSEMRGYWTLRVAGGQPHYFTFTPSASDIYELPYPITLTDASTIQLGAADSSGDLNTLLITLIGKPLPSSGIAVQ